MLHHNSGDLCNFKEQTYTSFLVPEVTGAVSYEDIIVLPPFLPILSQKCLSFCRDKDDSINVLFCNYS